MRMQHESVMGWVSPLPSLISGSLIDTPQYDADHPAIRAVSGRFSTSSQECRSQCCKLRGEMDTEGGKPTVFEECAYFLITFETLIARA